MSEVVAAAALAITGAGLLALLCAPVQGFHPAMRLALEFWTGAGLLHLSSSPSWSALGVVAAITGVRHLVQLAGDRTMRRARPPRT